MEKKEEEVLYPVFFFRDVFLLEKEWVMLLNNKLLMKK